MATLVGAQGETPGGQTHKQKVWASLNLTPEQKKQIHDIKKSGPDSPQRRKAIMSVLTPEQRNKYKNQMHSAPPKVSKTPKAGQTPAASEDEYEK